MNSIILKIDGMHCMGCALGLEENLEKLDFVISAKASFLEKQVEIEYENGNLDLNKIKEVIKNMNFMVI